MHKQKLIFNDELNMCAELDACNLISYSMHTHDGLWRIVIQAKMIDEIIVSGIHDVGLALIELSKTNVISDEEYKYFD